MEEEEGSPPGKAEEERGKLQKRGKQILQNRRKGMKVEKGSDFKKWQRAALGVKGFKGVQVWHFSPFVFCHLICPQKYLNTVRCQRKTKLSRLLLVFFSVVS